MITIQDLYNIAGNRISSEVQKSIIRNNYPPQIAERMCNAIDLKEKADFLLRYLNEWLEYQNRHQQIVQSFLR